MPSSPTKRTLDLLRRTGWTAGVVERWNAHAKVRQDLFNFADVVAVRSDQRSTLYVQATTRDHVSHRLEKLRTIPAVRTVLLAGNRVEVWGWKKIGGTWMVKKRVVTWGDVKP